MAIIFLFVEYGRSCKDIGCLPSEECQVSYASCSIIQQEGKDCGTYPTCVKRVGGSSSVPGIQSIISKTMHFKWEQTNTHLNTLKLSHHFGTFRIYVNNCMPNQIIHEINFQVQV